MSLPLDRLFRTLVIAGCLVLITGWAEFAHAQPQRRSPRVQGRDTATTALQPDFTARDLAIFTEELQLSEEQQDALDVALTNYHAQFDAKVREVRETLAELRPVSPEVDEETARRRAEMRTQINTLIREQRSRTRDVDDPEERRRLQEEYAAQIAAVREQYRDVAPEPIDPDEMSAMTAKRQETLDGMAPVKQQLHDEFIAAAQVMLSEEQMTKWPAVEQRIRREKTLRFGALSGERLDLLRLLRDLDLAVDPSDELTTAMVAYAARMEVALKGRNDYLEQSGAELTEAMRQGDQEKAAQLLDRQLQHHLNVRNVNDEHVLAFVEALPDEFGSSFQTECRRRAYRELYRETRGERMIQAAVALEDLSDSTVASVADLKGRYDEDIAQFRVSAMETIRDGEIEQFIDRRRPRQRGLTGNEGPGAGEGPGENPLRTVAIDRRALDDRYIAELESMLSPSQWEKLPGATPRAKRPLRGTGGGRGGDGRGPDEGHL